MLRVITLFSGYDSQCLALRRLGVDFDLVAWCEIDADARKAHNILFPEFRNRNIGDISKVDWSLFMQMRKENAIDYYNHNYLLFAPEQTDDGSGHIDLLTYSSPCQDFSQAGLQRGGEKGSGTRSGLLWECERAIDALRPKYLVFENVPALVCAKFKPTFDAWCEVLCSYGYRNYWQCLNAKNYGVPQNRKRIFMVSIHGDGEPYHFPEPFKLTRQLKDVLEGHVPEKYYLKDGTIAMMIRHNEHHANGGGKFTVTNTDGVANVVQADHCLRQGTNIIAEKYDLGWTRDAKGNVIDRHPVDVANCVTSGKRDNTQNYVVEPVLKQVGNCYSENTNPQYGRIYSCDGIAPTLTSMEGGNAQPKVVVADRLRRLTERELFRLMDMGEKDIDKLLSSRISKTQLMRMAGNSIVVGVLYHIFKSLFNTIENTPTPLLPK